MRPRAATIIVGCALALLELRARHLNQGAEWGASVDVEPAAPAGFSMTKDSGHGGCERSVQNVG